MIFFAKILSNWIKTNKQKQKKKKQTKKTTKLTEKRVLMSFKICTETLLSCLRLAE